MAKVPGLNYVASLVQEGKKVIWPSRQTVIRHTVLVVVSIAIAVVIFGSVDFGLQQLVLLSLGTN